jgi:hypothetical protein
MYEYRMQDNQRKKTEKDQKGHKGQTVLAPNIPYGLFQTKGEICAKFGSDWIRNVDLYKVQTFNFI